MFPPRHPYTPEKRLVVNEGKKAQGSLCFDLTMVILQGVLPAPRFYFLICFDLSRVWLQACAMAGLRPSHV